MYTRLAARALPRSITHSLARLRNGLPVAAALHTSRPEADAPPVGWAGFERDVSVKTLPSGLDALTVADGRAAAYMPPGGRPGDMAGPQLVGEYNDALTGQQADSKRVGIQAMAYYDRGVMEEEQEQEEDDDEEFMEERRGGFGVDEDDDDEEDFEEFEEPDEEDVEEDEVGWEEDNPESDFRGIGDR